MKFIEGKPRRQTHLFPVSLEASIDQDNEVRVVDLFVDSLNLQDYGFKVQFAENGRPAYRPVDLLKLYLYGYMNKVRSSRDLEKECRRNIEVMWLLKCLVPDHNTISNFRRDNPKAIKKVFRQTVQLAKHFELIGGKLIAGDSTKLRAQNSKKNNFNKKKIDRHLQYIDGKLQEYNHALAEAEADGDGKKKQIKNEIEKHNKRKQGYEQLQKQLDESGEEQISTSDTQSRQMITRNNITEVAYNVQSSVDGKHCLPIDYQVTNQNDSKAMGSMVRRAKTIVGNNQFTALFDKGYYSGTELKTAQELGITTLVAIPAPASNAPDTDYNAEHFVYDEEQDHYTCPRGEVLTTNGSIYTKNAKRQTPTQFKQYKTKTCKGCPVKNSCTKARYGKIIERNTHTPYYQQNKTNIEQNPQLYKRRQAIVEHLFGTLKRQWGFDHILTKQGIQRASADVGFMFIAYNLRRIINIVGKSALMAYLAEIARCFCLFFNLTASLQYHIMVILPNIRFSPVTSPASNRLYLSYIKPG